MPNIPDQIKIPRQYDKRVKLTETDKAEIRRLYTEESWPIRKIARKYEELVCRRTIQFVLFPERDKRLKELRSMARGHLKYYDRKKHSKCIKDLRKRKRQIFGIKNYRHSSNIPSEERERIKLLIANSRKGGAE